MGTLGNKIPTNSNDAVWIESAPHDNDEANNDLMTNI